MARWLITGGVGFIGFHLSRAILARGDDAVIVDDFSDAPYPLVMKRRNEADLLREFPKLKIVNACITDAKAMAPLFEKMDGIVHLAGLAGVRPSFLDPARYVRVNVEGTANLLELAIKNHVPRFVFASSSSVYGDSTPLPAHEDAPAIAPESPYAASKRGAELVAIAIAKRAPKLACTALRFFTVYGARQRPEMAITLFTRAILAREPITMFGDGSMRRDFTHVDDIVRGVALATLRSDPGYRVINLGSGAPIDLAKLVAAIGEAAGIEPVLHCAPVPLGDVEATFADITRAKSDLGWSPQVPLREGLATVLDWVRKNP
jgi:UDP-glucuronate 4-epimerase